jgi:hypothetical protein
MLMVLALEDKPKNLKEKVKNNILEAEIFLAKKLGLKYKGVFFGSRFTAISCSNC